MKKVINSSMYKFFLLFLFSCMQLALLAQDPTQEKSSQTTTTKTTTTESWYVQPWVWVVGAAVFVILIVALVRGNSSSNTETRTTVIKDNS